MNERYVVEYKTCTDVYAMRWELYRVLYNVTSDEEAFKLFYDLCEQKPDYVFRLVRKCLLAESETPCEITNK